MQRCIMRAHPSLPVCIIARIDSSVSRLLVTFGDDFLSSGCAGQGMLSRPSLTVYMIARIDLGIMRHHATSCDIVRQLSGVDLRRGADDSLYCRVRIPSYATTILLVKRRVVRCSARGQVARGDFFQTLGCVMRYRPSLTVYIIAHIDLGVLRHCAASCDIVRQLSGGDLRRAGYQ